MNQKDVLWETNNQCLSLIIFIINNKKDVFQCINNIN